MSIEDLELLDHIRLNFSERGLFFLNVTLFFVMFGVALEIKLSQIKEVFIKPKAALVGIVSQFLILPAVTFLFLYIFKGSLSLGVALGMILVAACPGGNISNFISTFAKGNAALSVSLTAVATIGAIIFTPINFSFWGNMFGKASPLLVPIEIDMFDMFKTVLLLLGLPIILGMLFNHKFPQITNKIKNPIKIASIVIFFGYVIAALYGNFHFFTKYVKFIFVLVLIHNVVALLSGFSMASIFKLTRKNRRTVTIETGIQNSGLALVLIFNPKIFPPELGTGGMAIVAAWWGVWHIVSGLLLAWLWVKKPLDE